MEDQKLIKNSIIIGFIGIIIFSMGYALYFSKLFNWYFNDLMLQTQVVSPLELIIMGFYLVIIITLTLFLISIFIREKSDENSPVHYAICNVIGVFIVFISFLVMISASLAYISYTGDPNWTTHKGSFIDWLFLNTVYFTWESNLIIFIGSLMYLLSIFKIYKEKKRVDRILSKKIEEEMEKNGFNN